MGGDGEEGVDTQACLVSGRESPSQDAYVLYLLAVTKGDPLMVPGTSLWWNRKQVGVSKTGGILFAHQNLSKNICF